MPTESNQALPHITFPRGSVQIATRPRHRGRPRHVYANRRPPASHEVPLEHHLQQHDLPDSLETYSDVESDVEEDRSSLVALSDLGSSAIIDTPFHDRAAHDRRTTLNAFAAAQLPASDSSSMLSTVSSQARPDNPALPGFSWIQGFPRPSNISRSTHFEEEISISDVPFFFDALVSSPFLAQSSC